LVAGPIDKSRIDCKSVAHGDWRLLALSLDIAVSLCLCSGLLAVVAASAFAAHFGYGFYG